MKMSLFSRWRTTKVFSKSAGPVLNADGSTSFEVHDYFISEAGMGDFLKEYMNVLSAPWWRRGKEWKQVEAKMRSILNEQTIRWE